MSDWSHGYNVSMGYSYGFYREMAPDWLDFCAWIGGFEPPSRAGRPFRYLELGCGQGFGLCLLAAANSGSGIPRRRLPARAYRACTGLADEARLSNVRLPAGRLPRSCRGMASRLRHLRLCRPCTGSSATSPRRYSPQWSKCLSHAVAQDGLVYVSYNAQPGCLSTVPLQHIAHRIKEIDEAGGAAPAEEAIALIDGLAAAEAPVFQVMPALKPRVDALKTRDRELSRPRISERELEPLLAFRRRTPASRSGTRFRRLGDAR